MILSRAAGDDTIAFPLSPDALEALRSCADGRDHNETAFALLVDAVRSADLARLADLGPAEVDVDAVLEGTDSARGTLVRVSGVLAQRTPLEEFWEGVEEWFVRLPDGAAICAFVVDPPSEVARGMGVTLVGASYKRMDVVGRDGQTRPFACVVARVARVGGGPSAIAPLATVVIAMLGGLVYARWRVRKARRESDRRDRSPLRDERAPVGDSADTAPLPRQAADALAALRKRHAR